jgi:hypothetical protein
MKSIISMMAVASIAFVAQGASLEDLYKNVCVGKVYTDSNEVTTTKYQPWEAILGYALGTQADPADTKSTCYSQVTETYRFIDEIVTQAYKIVNDFNLDATSSRVQQLA